MQNERTVAVQLITSWMETGVFADKLLDPVTENRAFITEVFYGVIKRQRTLDWILSAYAKRKPDHRILPSLYSAIYQLIFMNDPPAHAIINHTVESSKQISRGHFSGFTNAVLRKISLETGTILAKIESLPTAVRESHPEELYRRWVKHYGKEDARKLCEWNNSTPALIIRPNTNLTDITKLKKLLSDASVAHSDFPGLGEDFIIIGRGQSAAGLPGYKEGFFSVQDPSTAVSVELLKAEPGNMILDACAAPGGKTSLIAQAIRNTGRIIAMDPSRERLKRLEDNIRRLKTNECVKVVCADAADPKAVKESGGGMLFDRILADVPCSNTGALRRRPDARWRFSLSALKQMNSIQLGILDSVSQFLKPGGRLVYSTCSLEPEENDLLVEKWLAQHPDFTLEHSATIFPPKTGTDGAYAAAMVKNR